MDTTTVTANSMEATTADLEKNLSDILSRLGRQVKSFEAGCSKGEFNQSVMKEQFESYKDSLIELDKKYTISDNPLHQEMLASKDAGCVLLNIVIDLVEGLIVADDNQVIKWANLMISECWHVLIKLGKDSDNLFKCQQVLHLIDHVLSIFSALIGKELLNELNQESLLLCFDVLEDILYGTTELKQDEDTLPLTAIKKCIIDLQILNYPFLKPKGQALLCYLVSDTDHDLFPDLCIEEKLMSDIVQQVRLPDDSSKLSKPLQKIKSLAKIPGNRTLLRRHKLLPILETILEMVNSSEIESLSGELICTLLSDPPDAIEEALATIEEFIAISFKDGVPKAHLAGMKELLTAFVSTWPTSDHDAQVVMEHASHLYRVMVLSHDEFQRVLYSDQLIDVSYLVNTAKILKELNIIYENDHQPDKVIMIFENQITTVAKQFLSELVCVSLEAIHSSDLCSDSDRQTYLSSLLAFLRNLHFAFERWSRMNYDVKATLVSNAVICLLLQELHAASVSKMFPDDMVYSALTILYNVVLDPNLAKLFRIIITKKLLDFFVTKSDVKIRCLAKFSMGCMHMLLSRSEMNQVCLHSNEAEILARCLKGAESFFCGHDNLIVTIENLARIPKHWQIFLETGIVGALKVLAFKEGVATNGILRALLNMIPEPDVSNVQEKKPEVLMPLSNSVTAELTSDLSFMELVHISSEDICKGLVLLLSPPDSEELGIDDIQVLYNLKRYADCKIFCDHFIGKDSCNKTKAQLYQAKSLYYDYNRELIERSVRSTSMPGLEYKDAMQAFCKKRILQVIKTLAKTKETAGQASNDVTNQLFDNEASYVLDRALLDYLKYNTNEVSICLLCHSWSRKLIYSHIVPKAILQEFVKAMGHDTGDSVFIFSPLSDNPSSWKAKSAAKITLSMLCKTCDGTILSQDENLFKANFFSAIYQQNSPGSYLQEHCIPYAQFLYKFAAGIMFRNIAPLFSGLGTVCENLSQLHLVMQSCREVILDMPSSQKRPKIYMLALPSQIPNMLPQMYGWNHYVEMCNSPYGAIKLLQPENAMAPQLLYFFMVKIGVMVFLVSLDVELDAELEKVCPFYQIQSSDNEKTAADFLMKIPDDKERGRYIPHKIWWCLLGMLKKEMNGRISVTILSGGIQASLVVNDILASKDSIEPVTANLLPPGFALNFGSLPDVIVPNGHAILLHSFFIMKSGAKGCAIIGKLESSSSVAESKSKTKKPLYSLNKQPYVLIYYQDGRKKFILKTGFYLDCKSLSVKDTLPGMPASMKDSTYLKNIIEWVPDIIRYMLRTKGFRSLESLLFWQECLKAFFKGNDSKAVLTLDTRCKHECIYCEKRCDVCLQPCLEHFTSRKFPILGKVQCCSELCSKSLFTGPKECVITDKAEESLNGHKVTMQGCFTGDDLEYPGLMTTVQFIVCQTTEDIKGLYSIPSGVEFVMLWFRSIDKPTCIEYAVDNGFNAIEVLNSEESKVVFSDGEVNEMVSRLHELLVEVVIPYRFATLMKV